MIKTFILLTKGWDGYPIAFHMKQEGFDVMVGQVQDNSELGLDEKEEPEDKESRLKQYDGMLDKMTARELVNSLKKVEDKEDYFIFCDQNNLYAYAEELLEAGFTKGIFPTQDDYEFEKDRDAAMKFVDENYPDVQIVPFQEFSTVEEASAFLEESEGVYVVQSKGDYVSTVVPTSDDPEQAKTQVLNQLEKNKSEYEKGGIILKEKLINPIEITPQIVFWDGEPVFTDIDIETKNIGDGQNNGNQVGCGTNLIIRTELEDKINKIAFPKVVYDMAKERKGIFVWDISLYIMPDGIYFGEFCSNRFGYDALMTEMTMAGGASNYFLSISQGENPLKTPFGVAARIFNLSRKDETQISYNDDIQDYVWLYEVYQEDDRMLSLGDCWDLGVITCSGDTIQNSVDMLYEYIDQFSFKESYVRSHKDFLNTYPTSIIQRFMETNHKYFDAPDFNYDEKAKYEKKIQDMTATHHSEMKKVRDEIKSIINEAE